MKAVEGLGRILSMVQVTAAPLTANQGIYLSALELFRTCLPDNPREKKPREATQTSWHSVIET